MGVYRKREKDRERVREEGGAVEGFGSRPVTNQEISISQRAFPIFTLGPACPSASYRVPGPCPADGFAISAARRLCCGDPQWQCMRYRNYDGSE